MKRALVIEDHAFVAQALADTMRRLAPAIAVTVVHNWAAATHALKAAKPFNFILLDLRLPDASGLAPLKQLRQLTGAGEDAPRIAIVSGDDRAVTMKLAWDAGADGYIPKTHNVDEFEQALARFLSRGFEFPSSVRALSRKDLPRLSNRQREVLQLAAVGQQNKEIAKSLGIEVSTVKHHLRQVMVTLNAHTRTEAIMRGQILGLIEGGVFSP